MADSEQERLAAMLKAAAAGKQTQVATQVDVQARARERFRKIWDAVPEWQNALRGVDGDATVDYFLEDPDADSIVPGRIDVFVNGKRVAFPFKIQGSLIWFSRDREPHGTNDLSQLLEEIRQHIVDAAF